MKKILIFHHNDLDGMGVKILSILYAKHKGMAYETYKCNYHDVDDTVQRVLTETPQEEIEEVIIGDISVGKEEVAYLLQYILDSGIPVRLRDHHATAEWLNKFSWAKVAEEVDGVSRCGTYQLSLDADFSEILRNPLVSTFITEVDNWDTWKWKILEDNEASELNSLFQILEEYDFTNYILELFDDFKECILPDGSGQLATPVDLFTDYGKALIDAHNRSVRKNARRCESSMWVMNLEFPKKSKSYVTGVVFITHDISDVADIILSNHPELDILMLVGFPRNISFRTQKNLDIPLGDVAKLVTGSGGGHPMAAGSVISTNQFKKLFEKDMDILSGGYSGLKCTQLRFSEKE